MVNIRNKAPWLEDFLKVLANKFESKEVIAEPTTPVSLTDQLSISSPTLPSQQPAPQAPLPLGTDSKNSDTSAYLVSNPWDPRDPNYLGDSNNPNNPDPNDLIAMSRNINPILEEHRKYLPHIKWNDTDFWAWSNGNDTILVNARNTKAQTIEYYTTLDKVIQHLNGANPPPDVQMFTAPAMPAAGTSDAGLGGGLGGDMSGLDIGGGGDLDMPLASFKQTNKLIKEADFYDIAEDPSFEEELNKVKPYLEDADKENNNATKTIASEQQIIESAAETEGVGSEEESSGEMKNLVNSIMSRIKRMRNTEAASEQEIARNDPGNGYDLVSDAEEISQFQTSAKVTEEEIDADLSTDMSTPAGRYGGHDQHPTEQQYSRTNPGDVYNLNVDDTEIKDFRSAAEATEETIDRENTTDRSTVPGRYSTPRAATNNIMERILQARASNKQEDEEDLYDEDLNCEPDNERVVLLSSLLAQKTVEAEELLPDDLDVEIEKEDEEFFDPDIDCQDDKLLASNSIYNKLKNRRQVKIAEKEPHELAADSYELAIPEYNLSEDELKNDPDSARDFWKQWLEDMDQLTEFHSDEKWYEYLVSDKPGFRDKVKKQLREKGYQV